MTDYTGRLRLSIQDLNENTDNWGSVLNTGVFQLIDDAIAGVASVALVDGNNTLSTTDGANDESRYMILDLTGALTGAANVLVPEGTDGGGPTGEAPVVDTSKLYLAINNTTGGQVVTIKTTSGSGVALTAGRGTWVYCDGTDVFGANTLTADAATTATTATNATQLGGVAAASYARLDQSQTFTGAQIPSRTTLTAGATVSITASDNNRFYLQPDQNFTLNNPSAPADGQSISIIIEQPAMANYTITWGGAWLFQGGTEPTLTATNAAIDMLSAEYSTDAGGWIAGLMKDVK
jgi:hypothetical protein